MGERLTAEELGIREFELEALIWVRDALDSSISDHNLPEWIRFDMNNWVSAELDQPLSKCGTACCIGGSMEMYLAGMLKKSIGDIFSLEEYQTTTNDTVPTLMGDGRDAFSSAFDPLFFEYDSRSVSRRNAVSAIDQFLSGNTQDPWLMK